MFSITITGETLAQIAFNAARLAEEITAGIKPAETVNAETLEEKLPEEPAKEEPKKTAGRGRHTQEPKQDPEPEPKTDPEPKPARTRRTVTKPAEETEEQKKLREQIELDLTDLGTLAETAPAVRDDVNELLQRNGIKNVAEVTTDLLEQVADELAVLIEKYFDAA